MYELNTTEHDAVNQLNADYRQAHFKQKYQQYQELYLLSSSEGPYLLEDTQDDDTGSKATILPVWCHPVYAEEFRDAQNLEGFEVKGISATVFDQSWKPFLEEQHLLLGIMPDSKAEFNVAEPSEL